MLLSGFGMCAGYLDRFLTKNVDLERFYARRYGKILPFFAVTTAIGVVAEHSLRGVGEGIMELSLLYGLLPNNSNCFNVNGICWTMGTIFAFYLLFPFVSCMLRNRRRAWLSFACSLGIQALCEAFFMTDRFVVEQFLNRSNILYMMPVFLAGGLAYLYREGLSRWVARHQWIALAACLALSVAFYLTPDEVHGYDLLDVKALVVFEMWLIYALGAKSILLNNRFVEFIAGISMEIYLSHMILLKGVHIFKIDRLLGDGIVSYIVTYIVLFAGTVAFVKVVDFILRFVRSRLPSPVRQ